MAESGPEYTARSQAARARRQPGGAESPAAIAALALALALAAVWTSRGSPQPPPAAELAAAERAPVAPIAPVAAARPIRNLPREAAASPARPPESVMDAPSIGPGNSQPVARGAPAPARAREWRVPLGSKGGAPSRPVAGGVALRGLSSRGTCAGVSWDTMIHDKIPPGGRVYKGECDSTQFHFLSENHQDPADPERYLPRPGTRPDGGFYLPAP
jgi:hypothetical protein